MLFQVVYKYHCIDNIGASISLVYTICSAKNWQNILHILVRQAIVSFYKCHATLYSTVAETGK